MSGGLELTITSAAASAADEVTAALDVEPDRGLSRQDATARLGTYGPNAVSSHRAQFWPVLWHQVRSPLLGLLLTAAVASYFVGERSDAVIIFLILGLS